MWSLLACEEITAVLPPSLSEETPSTEVVRKPDVKGRHYSNSFLFGIFKNIVQYANVSVSMPLQIMIHSTIFMFIVYTVQ